MSTLRPHGYGALWHRLVSQLGRLGTLVPGQCALCHAWPAQPLCAACLASLATARRRCPTCARVLADTLAHCGACLTRPPPLDGCIAAVDYGWPWAGIVGRFKFRAQPGWAGTLAGLMRAAPGASDAIGQADWVLPIPLSRQRLRQRGYNQVLQLARHLGAETRLRADLLLRLQDTAAQSGLARAQRLRNLRGAFALEPLAAQAVAGRRVLLVDDVMTTGATLHAAALVLRAAGAAHIAALVLARTPARNDS